ncbi:hypothetical protein ACFYRC_04065 [Streptomyces sp. NPDC005279]|uniref:hypothetical protein n=1 Tax=Streptomyces sp. NPDC005279 TaxID=3364712 RepID=UPI0036843529
MERARLDAPRQIGSHHLITRLDPTRPASEQRFIARCADGDRSGPLPATPQPERPDPLQNCDRCDRAFRAP